MTAQTTKERLLRELWDREDRYYDLAHDQVRAAARLPGEYEFLRRWLPVRGTVLEVGCGEGSNLAVIERAGLQFVGCDLSALGLARAKAAAREAPPGESENALPEFLRADAERLPFPDRHFDAAFAVSLLEHLPDPATVIMEMLRVLAPGGRLILISPQYGGPLGASPCRRSGGAGRFLRRLARAHLPGHGGGGALGEVGGAAAGGGMAGGIVDRRSSTSARGARARATGGAHPDTVGGARISTTVASSDSATPVAGSSAAVAAAAAIDLGWDRVEPLVLQGEAYEGDLDAVIEPELASLKRFLRARGVTIEAATSGFEWHTWTGRRGSLPQRAARALLEPLGRAGIAPYRDFGPLVAVAGYKEFRG